MLMEKFDRKPKECKHCGCAGEDTWSKPKGKWESDWEHVGLGKWKCLICKEITEVELPPADNDFIQKMDLVLNVEKKLDKAKDDVGNRMDEVVRRWWKATGRTDSDELAWDDWEFWTDHKDGEVYLTFDWEVSWQYGGHADGSFSVPFRYFWDEDALCELERSEEQKRKNKKVNDKRKAKENRRKQYEKLKKEFEEDGEI